MLFYLIVVSVILIIALLVAWICLNNIYLPIVDFTPLLNTKNNSIFPLTSEQTLNKIKDNRNNKYKYKNKNKYKIALISLSVGDGREFAEASKKRLYQYADIHGYTLEYFDQTIDKNYSPMWQKVLAVKNVLNKNIYDYVVWVDDDIYITNTSFKIEDFINLTDKPIIMSRDRFTNDANLYINSGIYILKTNKIGKRFIQETIDNYNLMNGSFKYYIFHEQSVMTYLYFVKYYRNIEVLPFNVLQSFNELAEAKELYEFYHLISSDILESKSWREGDFTIHFAGVTREKRNYLMPKLLGKDKYINVNGIEYPITIQSWNK